MASNIRIGTSAWSDLGPFYPAGLPSAEQLGYYARHFPVVEINMTYYRVPTWQMAQAWVERTPDDFIFDVKPPRELTATPAEPGGEPPEPDGDIAAAFADSLEPLREAGKLGAVTFQFPPSWRNIPEHQEYLRLLPELMPGFPISVEFRRQDWLDEEHAGETLDLLRDAGLGYTMADEPQVGTGSVPPVYGVTNPDLAVIRFHGRNRATWYHFGPSSQGRFDWDYTPDEFDEWVPKIRAAANDARAVHIFFNTNRDNQGPRNAANLLRHLGLPAPSVAPEDPDQPRQATLDLGQGG